MCNPRLITINMSNIYIYIYILIKKLKQDYNLLTCQLFRVIFS